MKTYAIAALILMLFACQQQPAKIRQLQNRIDSLELKLSDTYKPGFGEFMIDIQAHHSKLWFAGKNQNWKLANFEIREIMASFDDIRKYETDREETQRVGMINSAIDSINKAIQQKNPILFQRSFVFMTNSCNSCHLVTKYNFNVIKIPETSPFSNQDFKVKE